MDGGEACAEEVVFRALGVGKEVVWHLFLGGAWEFGEVDVGEGGCEERGVLEVGFSHGTTILRGRARGGRSGGWRREV